MYARGKTQRGAVTRSVVAGAGFIIVIGVLLLYSTCRSILGELLWCDELLALANNVGCSPVKYVVNGNSQQHGKEWSGVFMLFVFKRCLQILSSLTSCHILLLSCVALSLQSYYTSLGEPFSGPNSSLVVQTKRCGCYLLYFSLSWSVLLLRCSCPSTLLSSSEPPSKTRRFTNISFVLCNSLFSCFTPVVVRDCALF